MDISLVDISGNETEIKCKPEWTIHDLTVALSEKMNIENSIIKIFDTTKTPKQVFLDEQTNVTNVASPLKNILFYQVIPKANQNPSENLIEVSQYLHSLIKATGRKISSDKKAQYRDYAQKVKQIPPDFKEKVDQLHDMGYPYEDCEVALRASHYDVEQAVNHLLYRNQERNIPSDSDLDLLEEAFLDIDVNNFEQRTESLFRLIQNLLTQEQEDSG